MYEYEYCLYLVLPDTQQRHKESANAWAHSSSARLMTVSAYVLELINISTYLFNGTAIMLGRQKWLNYCTFCRHYATTSSKDVLFCRESCVRDEKVWGWAAGGEECLHLDTDTADTHSFRCRIQRILGSRGRGTHLATTLPRQPSSGQFLNL